MSQSVFKDLPYEYHLVCGLCITSLRISFDTWYTNCISLSLCPPCLRPVEIENVTTNTSDVKMFEVCTKYLFYQPFPDVALYTIPPPACNQGAAPCWKTPSSSLHAWSSGIRNTSFFAIFFFFVSFWVLIDKMMRVKVASGGINNIYEVMAHLTLFGIYQDKRIDKEKEKVTRQKLSENGLSSINLPKLPH